MTSYKLKIIKILGVLTCFGVFLTTGCITGMESDGYNSHSKKAHFDITKKHEKAIKFYFTGDYRSAISLFDILAEQTKDLHIARKALFGLACSKFMIADSPESYADAIKLWEKWTKFAPRSWENENPILVAPLVREKMLFSNIPPLPITGNDSFKIKKMTSKQLLIRTTQELDIHKRKLKDSEAKSRGQTVKINNLKNEIVKLKRQIKALETIDQKIQKKKNAIPQRIDD